jgi:hypothetical protein
MARLRDVLLLSFLGSTILSMCGLVHYWNPNLMTLSQVYGNYSDKIYFFFLINLFGMFCVVAYEYSFNDIFSTFLALMLGLSYVLLLWISEDVLDSFKFKSHVILSAMCFSFLILYILYHAIRMRDPFLFAGFALGIGLFWKICANTISAYSQGLAVEDMVLEEITMVGIAALTFVRRGGYI